MLDYAPIPYLYALNRGARYTSVSLFPDPFLDIAAQALPVSIQAMLRHAEFLAITNPTFREALNKIAAYFVTDIEIDGEISREEKEKYINYLKYDMSILSNLTQTALNLLVYGNCYISVIPRFIRFVVCPKCQSQFRLEEVIFNEDFRFRWAPGFYLKCLICKFEGDFRKPKDVLDETKPPIYKLWNVHDIRIVNSEWTDTNSAYHWIIPASQRDAIRNGRNLHALLDTPWEVIEAILNNKDLEYPADYILHIRESQLCGLRFGGVGVPRSIVNFRLLYLIQAINRMNEVLAFGHIAPIRVISPADSTLSSFSQGGGLLQAVPLQAIRRRIEEIIANHRNDPNSINFSPIPIQMQALGADARQFVAADIITHYQETLLNGVGVPVEFYRANMQTQAAPVALRLLERYWSPLVSELNRVLDFVGKKLKFLKNWQDIRIRLKPVRLADAVEMSVLRVQMANAGLISRTTALQQVDADFVEETRKKFEEMKIEMQEESKARQESELFAFSKQLGQIAQSPQQQQVQQQDQQQGQPAAGPAQQGATPDQAAAAGGGQVAPGQTGAMIGTIKDQASLQRFIPRIGERIDPQEYASRVQMVANFLLTLAEPERLAMLRAVREANDAFHSAVLGTMEKIRRDAANKGKQIVLQQLFGQRPQ